MKKNHKYNLWKWRSNKSDLIRMVYWRTRAEIAESCLRILFKIKQRNLAEHINDLEQKCKRQAWEITNMREVAEERNKERKALNILVACDGNCNAPYMEDPSQIDEQVIRLVVGNALRLVHWWDRGGMKTRDAYLQRAIPELEKREKKNNV